MAVMPKFRKSSGTSDPKMVTEQLSTTDLQYLLGAVGIQLRDGDLIPEDRLMFTALRDRLARHLTLDDELKQALGLSEPEARH